MSESCFELKLVEGRAYLSIDVANESMNTLRAEFAPQLSEILAQLSANSEVYGLIIMSAKPDCFIAGADISMLQACSTAEEAELLSAAAHRVFQQLSDLAFPVVAAIDGVCLGGGLELALACDYRLCGDNPKVRLGLPEVQLGLLPGGGGTQRLPALVGIQQALELMLTGKQLRAKAAVKIALVNEVVASAQLLSVAEHYLEKGKPQAVVRRHSLLSWCLEATPWGRKILFSQVSKRILAKTRGHYPAPFAIIACVKAFADQASSTAYLAEAKAFAELVLSKESKALRQLFFATNALKKTHTFSPLTPQVISRVGVLGGGLMGAGIAYVSMNQAQCQVRLKDVSHSGVNAALAYSYRLLSNKRRRGFLSSSQLSQQMACLSGTVDYSGFSQCEAVIEAVFEDVSLKQKMVAEVEQHTAASCIFASNTSSIPIASIAAKAERPEKVIGLHYFSPVEKMPLAEVIPHAKTSEQTVCDTLALARAQGKTAIVVKDSAGFYVNRILAPYINEAVRLLLEGQGIEHIDQALLDYGFPVGPMALLDEVGMDVAFKISPILEQQFGERFAVPEAMQILLSERRFGKKTGKGLYRYPKGQRKGADPTVYRLLKLKPAAQAMAKQEIAQRCVLLMLNEAARCLDEQVIRCARDGDLGAIFGIGFPPFLGGPFALMRQLGAANLHQQLTEHQQRYGERFQPIDNLTELVDALG